MTESPPPTRTDDIPAAFDDRTVLLTMLDYVRDTVAAKCRGLSDADAHRTPLPGSPLMSIAALVSHLRWVEHHWIEVVALDRPDQGPWTDDDPDREMRIAADIPIDALLADYADACARHRSAIEGIDLDAASLGTLPWRTEPLTLRWILMHLIEETARHNGHIDLLRELADGVTGT
jgi:uncharacterized damage-inducible protein DinB